MLIQLGKNWHFENSDEPIAELGFCKATMNIENETVFYKKWIEKAFCCIKDIL